MGERKVPQPIISQPWETRSRRTAKIRGWQRLVLCAVGQKETTRELALVGMQVVQINDELVFIEFSRDAE